MAEKRTFRATIQQTGGGGAFVTVPFDVEAHFGRKRVPVAATFDGEPYRGSLVRMGGPHHMLIVLKEIRERIGKGPGDEVEVTVEEDATPRVVEIPADLREALDGDPVAAELFRGLSYSHQREYVLAVEGAKREETRRNRVARTIQDVRAGKKPK